MESRLYCELSEWPTAKKVWKVDRLYSELSGLPQKKLLPSRRLYLKVKEIKVKVQLVTDSAQLMV